MPKRVPDRIGGSSSRWPIPYARTERERLALLDRPMALVYPEQARIRSALANIVKRHRSVAPVILFGTPDNGRTTLARQLVKTSRQWAGGRATATTLTAFSRSGHTRLRLTGPREGGPWLVVVDECDALAEATTGQCRLALARFRRVAEMGATVVAVGNGRLASRLLSDADHVGPVERLYLPRWEMGPDYLALLRGIELLLPLRERSALDRGDLAVRLHVLSDGRLGALTRMLRAAAAAAIQSGRERIEVELLEHLGFRVQPGPTGRLG